MTDRLNLPSRYRRILEALLREHVPDAAVWAYGSRINGESHEGSDLDLVLRGTALQPLGVEYVDLIEAFERSNIPFLIQAHDWARLPESFRREIERDYVVVVQEGVKQTTAGEWREMPFSEAVLVNPPARLDRGATYPFVDMAAVSAESRSVSSTEERAFSGSGSRFQSGDTLMARITPCLENGKIARYMAPINQQKAHGSTEFIVIRGRAKVTDNDFAYYLTKSDEVREYAISQMTGTSGRQRVPVGTLDHLIVPLPPMTEQRAIAHILGTLDDKIELNRRMNETLEEMARALFKSWFVDFDPVRAKAALKTSPAEASDWTVERARAYLESMDKSVVDLFPDRLVDSELGKIPEGWEVKALGDVVEVVGGTTPSTKKPEYWEGGIHCWATPKDLATLAAPVLLETERKITDSGLQRIGSGLLPRGAVLLSSRAPIGYLAIAETPVAINQGFIGILPREGLSNLFMLYWCEASQEEIVSHANGSTFLEISKSNFRRIPVVVPGEATLTAFDRRARPLYERIASNERESRALTAQRDALLPKLVSGEVGVGDDPFPA